MDDYDYSKTDSDALQGKQEIESRRRTRRLQSTLAEIGELESEQQFATALEKAQVLQAEFPAEKSLAATVKRLERKACLRLHQATPNAQARKPSRLDIFTSDWGEEIIITKEYRRVLRANSPGRAQWIRGMPQVGKTQLLNYLRDSFRKEGLRVEVIDGNRGDLTETVQEYVKQSSTPNEENSHQNSVPQVLLLEEIDTFLLQGSNSNVKNFLSSLKILTHPPRECSIFLFSYLSISELAQRRAEIADTLRDLFPNEITLSPWDDATVQGYLAYHGIPQSYADIVISVTAGIPVLVVKSKEMWLDKYPDGSEDGVHSKKAIEKELETLLSEATDNRVWEALFDEEQFALCYLVAHDKVAKRFRNDFERIVEEVFCLSPTISSLQSVGILDNSRGIRHPLLSRSARTQLRDLAKEKKFRDFIIDKLRRYRVNNVSAVNARLLHLYFRQAGVDIPLPKPSPKKRAEHLELFLGLVSIILLLAGLSYWVGALK